MINQPPIDKLVNEVGCRYSLVTVVAKRARQLLEAQALQGNEKSVTKAVNELYSRKLHIANNTSENSGSI